VLPPPLSLAPPDKPVVLQQVDEAEGQVGIGADGVGVEQLMGTA